MTNTGSPLYQAPEMIEGTGSYYDEKVDMWSAGCIIYFMCTGKEAFKNYSANENDQYKLIEQAILSGKFNDSDPSY